MVHLCHVYFCSPTAGTTYGNGAETEPVVTQQGVGEGLTSSD